MPDEPAQHHKPDQTPLLGTRRGNTAMLLGFIASVKPAWARSTDCMIMVALMAATNNEGIARISQATLASWCGLKWVKSVGESLKLLSEHGWITIETGKQSFNANSYSVAWWAIPKGGQSTNPVTPEAKKLAGWYYSEVMALPKKRSLRSDRLYRPPVGRNWQQRWQYVMQCWLDEGRSAETIKVVCGWAFSHYMDLARRGPQTLKAPFDRLLTDASAKVTNETIQLPIEKVGPA
jgi:hypothetical protein